MAELVRTVRRLCVFAIILTDTFEFVKSCIMTDLGGATALLTPIFFSTTNTILRVLALAPLLSVAVPHLLYFMEIRLVGFNFLLRSQAIHNMDRELEHMLLDRAKEAARTRREMLQSRVRGFWRSIVSPATMKPFQALEQHLAKVFNAFMFFTFIAVAAFHLVFRLVPRHIETSHVNPSFRTTRHSSTSSISSIATATDDSAPTSEDDTPITTPKMSGTPMVDAGEDKPEMWACRT